MSRPSIWMVAVFSDEKQFSHFLRKDDEVIFLGEEAAEFATRDLDEDVLRLVFEVSAHPALDLPPVLGETKKEVQEELFVETEPQVCGRLLDGREVKWIDDGEEIDLFVDHKDGHEPDLKWWTLVDGGTPDAFYNRRLVPSDRKLFMDGRKVRVIWDGHQRVEIKR